MWKVMLYFARPNGCNVGAANPLVTGLAGIGEIKSFAAFLRQKRGLVHDTKRVRAGLGPIESTRTFGVLVNRTRCGQSLYPKPLQPFADSASMLSGHLSRTFATKSSVVKAKGQRQPTATKSHQSVPVGRGEARQKIPATTAHQASAFAGPAPQTAGLPRSSVKTAAAGAESNKSYWNNTPLPTSHPKQCLSGNGQGNVAESGISQHDADQERRQRSSSVDATTSASSGKAPYGVSREAYVPHNLSIQSAVTSNSTQHNTAPHNGAAFGPIGFNQPGGHSSDTRPSPGNAPTTMNSSQSADTSAGSTDARQSTASVSSVDATHAERSMYAQREVPFDVKASRKNGTTAIRDLLETQKITLQEYAPGQKPKVLCPRCHGGSQHEASLAVNISVDSQSAAWMCHRATCGWEGGIDQKTALPKGKKTAVSKVEKPQTSKFRPLDSALVSYFANRGITKQTLERNRVAQEHTWMPNQPNGTAIAFPYLRNGEVVNVKYRTMDKSFRQVKGAEKILYGLDDIVGQETIIIVEGEMDKLALEEAGFMNVVSVPDGAPAKVKETAVPAPDADTKYSYLWNCRAVLDQATRILMATDNDPPGHALAEELARRLGRERCYRVQWELPAEPEMVEGVPEEQLAEASLRKDANEVLMKDGADALRLCIDQAEPLPIRGLFRFSDFQQDLWSLYNLEFGDQMGKATGWPSLDEIYRVVPGELTIITGVPNSGKSEWIDALMVNLADRFGWRFGLCSMEKKVTDHARQLMEKYLRKPFFDGGYAGSMPRMNAADLEEGIAWVDDRFFPIRYEDEALPSVDWVLNVAKAAVLRYGIRGLLVDPYNELDHQRPSHMSETEYVSQMLTKIKRFAQHHDVHVWFVAHPRQLRDWKGQPPTMYDISGSAHFINKADNGLVIHRNRDPQAGPMNEVQIFVRKVRNKAAGTIGDCKLGYDRATGCYIDHADTFASFPQPAPETARHLLSSAGPSYDESLERNTANGDADNAPEKSNLQESRGVHTPSMVDKVFTKSAASSRQLEYDDTDLRPGDVIKKYDRGQMMQDATSR